MNDDGTEVFDQEDCLPCYLRAQVFDVDGGLVAEASGLDQCGGGRGDEAAIAALGYAKPVRGDLGGRGEGGVQVRCWGGGGDGDFFGKFFGRLTAWSDGEGDFFLSHRSWR